MARIFLSYRREDAGGHAGRLYDALAHRFGAAEVFRDLDTLTPGVDFVESIERSIAAADVVLAVIGRDWVTALDSEGKRRLDRVDDYVRVELELALQREVQLIPVLVRRAEMPRPEELPAGLAPLTRRNAVDLPDQQWPLAIEGLIKTLEEILSEPGPTKLEYPAWNSVTARKINRFTHLGGDVRISGDGNEIVTNPEEGSLGLWNVETADEISRQTVGAWESDVMFTARGFRHARIDEVDAAKFVHSSEVMVLDASGSTIARLGHNDSVQSARLSPNGVHVTTAWGQKDTNVQVWDIDEATSIASMPSILESVTAMRFSPDGQLFTAGTGKRVRVWDAASGALVAELQSGWTDDVALSLKGTRLASWTSVRVSIWDIRAGVKISELTHDGRFSNYVSAVDFSPQGDLVATGSHKGTAHLWNAAQGTELSRTQHGAHVTAVRFGPNGDYVVTASWDGTVRIWPVGGQQPAVLGHGAGYVGVDISADGTRVATGAGDGTARVWELSFA